MTALNWTTPSTATPPPDTEVVGRYDIGGAFTHAILTCEDGFWTMPARTMADAAITAHEPDFWLSLDEHEETAQ